MQQQLNEPVAQQLCDLFVYLLLSVRKLVHPTASKRTSCTTVVPHSWWSGSVTRGVCTTSPLLKTMCRAQSIHVSLKQLVARSLRLTPNAGRPYFRIVLLLAAAI